MPSEQTPDISIVIPAYNASAFIEKRLTELAAFLKGSGLQSEIIPVDDGSQDNTADILRSLKIPECRPLFESVNCGKYSAIRKGVAHARGKVIFLTDADIPYELSAIPFMAGLIERGAFHLIVGDRNLPGSIYESQLSALRRFATGIFTWIVRILVTSGLHDTQCGLKAIRGDIARLIFPMLKEDGFSGDVELLYVALKYNLAIRRVPVRLQFQGNSTVSPFRHGLVMFYSLFRIRNRHRHGDYISPTLAALSRQDYWSMS